MIELHYQVMPDEKLPPTRKLADFLIEASEISNLSTDYSIKWSDNNFLAVDIHDKYIKWKFNVSDFLYSLGLIDDGNFFTLGGVPLIKAGIEYGDKDSTESRKLIEDIRVELNEKLRHLREPHILEKINNGNNPTPNPVKNTNKKNSKDVYEIKLKDRNIFINEFLLSRPFPTGSNMEFFEYVFNNPNKKVTREDLPKTLKKKSVTDILSELGFTGEFLKAFFPKRSKNFAFFRKTINAEGLLEAGVDITKFKKQLNKLKK